MLCKIDVSQLNMIINKNFYTQSVGNDFVLLNAQ